MGNVLYEAAFQPHSMYFSAAWVFAMTAVPFLFLHKKRAELETQMQVVCFFSGLIAVGALIAQIIIGACAVRDYQQIIVSYQAGDYETVEGPVAHFTPMPYEGHGLESFEIDGVYFEYSDYVIQQGYHNTRSHGGVISGDGQNLKIGYIELNKKNYIVYIEEISSQRIPHFHLFLLQFACFVI